MSFIKVDINTNPIPEGVLEPKPFSFPSGGSGGGGGGTIYPTGYNMNGKELLAPIEVPINTEVTLAEFDINFVGGKKALFIAFATYQGEVINTKFDLFVKGVKVTGTSTSKGQSLSWGTLIDTVPGLATIKITATNNGALPLPVPSAGALVMEFLV